MNALSITELGCPAYFTYGVSGSSYALECYRRRGELVYLMVLPSELECARLGKAFVHIEQHKFRFKRKP